MACAKLGSQWNVSLRPSTRFALAWAALFSCPATPSTPPNAGASILRSRTRPTLLSSSARLSDVIECVRFARAQGLGVHVRGGGHGDVAISSGILLSMRRLNGVRRGAGTEVAAVGAGVRWGEVIARAAEQGLAPISGSSPTVGVVGFLLGGGLGPLSRSHGFGSDYLVGATLVTASGEWLEMNADEHADLLWALRGGKGGFGVVTEVRLRLVSLRTLYGGSLLFDTKDMEAAFRAWVSWLACMLHLPSRRASFLRASRRATRSLLRCAAVACSSVRFAFPGGQTKAFAWPHHCALPLPSISITSAKCRPKNGGDPQRSHRAAARIGARVHVDPRRSALADVLFSHLGPTQETPFANRRAPSPRRSHTSRRSGGSAVGGRESSFTFSCISTGPCPVRDGRARARRRSDARSRSLALRS